MDYIKKSAEFDLIGMGEVMLRLSPPGKEKLSQSETFEKNAGGSELNVASGAAMLGIRSAIITRLPRNKIGHFISRKIRYGNVSDDYIVYDETEFARLGLYYYESGVYPANRRWCMTATTARSARLKFWTYRPIFTKKREFSTSAQ